MEMVQTTKIGSKVISTFGLNDKYHKIACDRIANDQFGDITKDGCFLSMPDDELIQNWIDQNDDNSEFLKDAVNSGATIYTLWEHIFGDAAQPLGDIAVFSED
jgi:hypothetical protein